MARNQNDAKRLYDSIFIVCARSWSTSKKLALTVQNGAIKVHIRLARVSDLVVSFEVSHRQHLSRNILLLLLGIYRLTDPVLELQSAPCNKVCTVAEMPTPCHVLVRAVNDGLQCQTYLKLATKKAAGHENRFCNNIADVTRSFDTRASYTHSLVQLACQTTE